MKGSPDRINDHMFMTKQAFELKDISCGKRWALQGLLAQDTVLTFNPKYIEKTSQILSYSDPVTTPVHGTDKDMEWSPIFFD